MEDVVHIKSDEGILKEILILPGAIPIQQPNPDASKRQIADKINNTLLINKSKDSIGM